MEVAQKIITNRVNQIGVSSPTVTVHGDEIVIEFGGVHHPAATARILADPGQLQLFDFEPSLAPPTVRANQQPAPFRSLYSLLRAAGREETRGTRESYYLFKMIPSHPVLQGPAPSLHQLLRPYEQGKQPAGTVVLKVPANREPVGCNTPRVCPGAGNGSAKGGEPWYLFKLPPALTGKDLVEEGIVAGVDPSTGRPIVTLQFTGHGAQEFKRLTKAEYERGRVNAGEAGRLNAHSANVISRFAGHNAVVLDGRLDDTPYIDYTDVALSQGIIGTVEITEPSAAAASRTALVLQTGSLPYTFRQVSRTTCPR